MLIIGIIIVSQFVLYGIIFFVSLEDGYYHPISCHLFLWVDLA